MKILTLILALSTSASALSYTADLTLAKPATGDKNYVTPFATSMDTLDAAIPDKRVNKTATIKSTWTIQTPLTVASSVTVTGNAFSVGGSTLVVANGKVGIGVASPLQALHVNGVVQNSGIYEDVVYNNYFAGPITVGNPTPTSGFKIDARGPIISSGTSAGLYFSDRNGAKQWGWYSSGNVAILSHDNGYPNTISVNSANNYVGIGTTAPSQKLQISSGTIHIDGSGSPTVGGALCLNATGNMSKCTSAVDASGNCTCN